jgi:hypothetical protein
MDSTGTNFALPLKRTMELNEAATRTADKQTGRDFVVLK